MGSPTKKVQLTQSRGLLQGIARRGSQSQSVSHCAASQSATSVSSRSMLRERASEYARSAAESQRAHALARPPTLDSRHRGDISGPRQLWRPGTPPFYRTWVSSPRLPLSTPEADTTGIDIRRFERKNHASLELNDYSKKELVTLITMQGLEPPGRLIWDPVSVTMVRENLTKQTYVDFCRQKFYETDPQPVVRVGLKIRPHGDPEFVEASRKESIYRIISVYRADNCGVRLVAYDPMTSKSSHLLLLKQRLEELHVEPAPRADVEYPEWSRGLVERLEIAKNDEIRVGRQPLQANGLTLNFSLSGHREQKKPVHITEVVQINKNDPARYATTRGGRRSSLDYSAQVSSVVLANPPSRHMVTQWFDFM